MPRYPTPKVPTSCENISIELAKRVLAQSWGNVARAAEELGVPTRDFRFLVRTTPELTAVAYEAGELFCDKAEDILRDALESENEARRDVASRFVLGGRGLQRGWARPTGPALTVEHPAGQITLKWRDGAEFEMSVGEPDVPALIDAKPDHRGDDPIRDREAERSS